MLIQWYGHSCFLLTTGQGVRILTDPCAPQTGYALAGIDCDIITSSHGHYDHNYFAAAAGSPEILTTAGGHTAHGVRITGVQTFHDGEHGRARGENIVFIIEADGMRVAHLGDLGHRLTPGQAAAIGQVDVLLCPIGGIFTIDAEGALAVAQKLQPKVLIPMHYQTPALAFDLNALEPLLEHADGRTIHRVGAESCSITPDSLGEPRIVVLDYVK